MSLFDYLEKKQKEEQLNNNRVKIYNDIACLLWYQLLYDDILKHKREQMDIQQNPFRIYDFGHKSMRFGGVSALTSSEDLEKVEKRAKALLKDKGYGNFKVKVYPDAIVLSVF